MLCDLDLARLRHNRPIVIDFFLSCTNILINRFTNSQFIHKGATVDRLDRSDLSWNRFIIIQF